MTTKMHPIHWLPRTNEQVTEQVLRDLDANSSGKRTSVDGKETRFLFDRREIMDSYDREILVADGRFSVVRLPHCQCVDINRSVVDCECEMVACRKCGKEHVALTHACDSILCLYDECDCCRHYRDECYAAETEAAIHQAAEEVKSDDVTWAEAYQTGVDRVIGACGDAPYFVVVGRALNQVAKKPEDLDRGGPYRPEPLTWELKDGTFIYTRDRVWLHTDKD